MSKVAAKRKHRTVSERAARALGSAAGALAYAEGAEDVLEMSDADVGQLIKLKAKDFKRAIAGMDSTRDARPQANTKASREQHADMTTSRRPKRDAAVVEDDGRIHRRRLVSSKKLLSSGEMQSALAVTRQALSAATKSSRMFTVEVDGRTYYPAFFAEGDVDRAVLERISRALRDIPGWLKWDFFTAARGSLGDVSPLKALCKGKVTEVEHLAHADVAEMDL